MRWDALFGDLEAQLVALGHAERAVEVAERQRGEVGRLRLVDRARAAVGQPVWLRAACGFSVRGTLRRVGPDWWLVAEDTAREVVVVAAALQVVRGLGRYAAAPGSEGVVASRLGLRHALRGIARDRDPVRLHLVDGSTVDATLDRVGADFVDVATHPAGERRRRTEVSDADVVPLDALVAVRRG